MNIMEKQAELGRSLFEINTNTLKELAALQRENVEGYFETNRNFGERLPEIKGMSDFVELQREYGETLWNNVRKAVESQNEIIRSAFEETSEAVKVAFTPEAEEKPKAKAKSKKAVTEEN
ncbi:MAG TPA: phasin family protein [Pseudomonadales bacterium]|nr:phasin family protein [Pseudomonadales bacterium]